MKGEFIPQTFSNSTLSFLNPHKNNKNRDEKRGQKKFKQLTSAEKKIHSKVSYFFVLGQINSIWFSRRLRRTTAHRFLIPRKNRNFFTVKIIRTKTLKLQSFRVRIWIFFVLFFILIGLKQCDSRGLRLWDFELVIPVIFSQPLFVQP